jgi:predicted GNAT superfamily acetyltransferase
MLRGPAEPLVRRLTADDADALAKFSCRRYRQPWTDVVDELVREKLAAAIALGDGEGLGLWVGDDLVGVAAWRMEGGSPPICHSIVVAVRVGAQRSGHGKRLKRAMIEQATAVGAAVVVSMVHWDNDAMIALNAAFGANVERIPGDYEYCRCVVALPLRTED